MIASKVGLDWMDMRFGLGDFIEMDGCKKEGGKGGLAGWAVRKRVFGYFLSTSPFPLHTSCRSERLFRLSFDNDDHHPNLSIITWSFLQPTPTMHNNSDSDDALISSSQLPISINTLPRYAMLDTKNHLLVSVSEFGCFLGSVFDAVILFSFSLY